MLPQRVLAAVAVSVSALLPGCSYELKRPIDLSIDRPASVDQRAIDRAPASAERRGDGPAGPRLPGSRPGLFRPFNNSWLLNTTGSLSSPGHDKVFFDWGQAGDLPVVGDWNGDGKTETGFYRNGYWKLDLNNNGKWDVSDKALSFGNAEAGPGDLPAVGDWNGDGKTEVGVYRTSGRWFLDLDGDGLMNDPFFDFGGLAGDVPVTGDWNGDKKCEVGIFRDGFLWLLDTNANRQFDQGVDAVFPFGGIPGDLPVVGDWNNDGKADPGIFRYNEQWLIDTDGIRGWTQGVDGFFLFGGGAAIPGDRPVSGQF